MLLGGLWHGAGWTFVIWGAIHGFYLVLNHVWRSLYFTLAGRNKSGMGAGRYIARFITFLAVVVAWVFFRAESLDSAIQILNAMVGANGILLPTSYLEYFNHFFSLGDLLKSIGWRFEGNVPYFGGITQFSLITLLLVIVWALPNTYQFFGDHSPIIDSTSVSDSAQANPTIRWRPSPVIALPISLLLFFVIFKMDSTSEFLYFQF